MADDNLPEGTDTIITDAEMSGTGSDLGGAGSGSGGSTGGGANSIYGGSTNVGGGSFGGGTSGTGASSGFGAGSEAGIDLSSGTGATGASTSGATGDTASSSGSGGGVKQVLKNSTDKLRSTAGEKAMSLVGQGLERSQGALNSVSTIIGETAASIDERLGSQYGDYARSAAQAVERFAGSLSNKQPEELVDDARTLVRKSPGVALAGAAILGFALVRVVKSGLEDSGVSRRDDTSSRTSA